VCGRIHEVVGAESPAHAHLHRVLRVAAALIATLGFTQWVVSREAERTLRRELSTTAEVFNGLVKERGARLETNSALLASDFALKRVIATYFDPATYSAETLASAARSYQSRIGVDLLWIADDQGRILVNLPASPKGLKPQIGYSPISESLETETRRSPSRRSTASCSSSLRYPSSRPMSSATWSWDRRLTTGSRRNSSGRRAPTFPS
jgi:hypothetical protein